MTGMILMSQCVRYPADDVPRMTGMIHRGLKFCSIRPRCFPHDGDDPKVGVNANIASPCSPRDGDDPDSLLRV